MNFDQFSWWVSSFQGPPQNIHPSHSSNVPLQLFLRFWGQTQGFISQSCHLLYPRLPGPSSQALIGITQPSLALLLQPGNIPECTHSTSSQIGCNGWVLKYDSWGINWTRSLDPRHMLNICRCHGNFASVCWTRLAVLWLVFFVVVFF